MFTYRNDREKNHFQITVCTSIIIYTAINVFFVRHPNQGSHMMPLQPSHRLTAVVSFPWPSPFTALPGVSAIWKWNVWYNEHWQHWQHWQQRNICQRAKEPPFHPDWLRGSINLLCNNPFRAKWHRWNSQIVEKLTTYNDYHHEKTKNKVPSWLFMPKQKHLFVGHRGDDLRCGSILPNQKYHEIKNCTIMCAIKQHKKKCDTCLHKIMKHISHDSKHIKTNRALEKNKWINFKCHHNNNSYFTSQIFSVAID